MTTTIRAEIPSDEDAIEQVTRRAFLSHPHSHQTEQFIIRALRADHALSVSLVAEDAGRIVGHLALSPVTISDGAAGWYGLGPISVEPELQRRGIGRALMQKGLAELRKIGASECVLVGDPSFYIHFGLRTILLSCLSAFRKSSACRYSFALLPRRAKFNSIQHFKQKTDPSPLRPIAQ